MRRVAASSHKRVNNTKTTRNVVYMPNAAPSFAVRASGCLTACWVLLTTTPLDTAAAELFSATKTIPEVACGLSMVAGSNSGLDGAKLETVTCPDIQPTSALHAYKLAMTEAQPAGPSPSSRSEPAATLSEPQPRSLDPLGSPPNQTAHRCDIARLRGPVPYSADISSRLTYTICGLRSGSPPVVPGRSA